MQAYSVLMSVYAKAEPEWFRRAVESMLEQTAPPEDFVIVCDGPLTSALEAVLSCLVGAHPGLFQIVRLEENVGIGAAANMGLGYCKYDLVAKMDADDIALPQRCQKQLERFQEKPELMLLGTFISEFEDTPDKPFAVRAVPGDNESIRRFSRRRQSFNNMTVMYRKSAVEAVGGYRELRRNEDYDLYLRLLNAGCYAENLEQVLVYARVNRQACSRRASWETFLGCVRSRWYALRVGFSSPVDFLVCVGGAFLIFIAPDRLQRCLYRRFLRRAPEPPEA